MPSSNFIPFRFCCPAIPKICRSITCVLSVSAQGPVYHCCARDVPTVLFAKLHLRSFEPKSVRRAVQRVTWQCEVCRQLCRARHPVNPHLKQMLRRYDEWLGRCSLVLSASNSGTARSLHCGCSRQHAAACRPPGWVVFRALANSSETSGSGHTFAVTSVGCSNNDLAVSNVPRQHLNRVIDVEAVLAIARRVAILYVW